MKINICSAIVFIGFLGMSLTSLGESLHSDSPMFDGCKGKVVAGYQGWFRFPGDGSGANGSNWGHWGSRGQEFGTSHCTIDIWPYTKEYPKVYPTNFKNPDGSAACVFSSYDESTVDVHFKWMKEYGIDAAFLQRFYSYTKNAVARPHTVKILEHCLKAAKKHGVGIILMYDVSGMPKGKVADGLIADFKMILDSLNPTGGKNTPYLFHNGKPLVCIWGIGFNDRHYSPADTDILKFFDFLKNDKTYGGCSVMVGVPTYWRTLDRDCVKNPDFHKFIKEQVDVLSPWTVGRLEMLDDGRILRGGMDYVKEVKADKEWCDSNKITYMPVVYPGFSWYNKMHEHIKGTKFNHTPRAKGKFFWNVASGAAEAGAETLYIAMFDEVDEATAIFKLEPNPPRADGVPMLDTEGLPPDHYLFLAGNFKKLLKTGKSAPMPSR